MCVSLQHVFFRYLLHTSMALLYIQQQEQSYREQLAITCTTISNTNTYALHRALRRVELERADGATGVLLALLGRRRATLQLRAERERAEHGRRPRRFHFCVGNSALSENTNKGSSLHIESTHREDLIMQL